MTAYYNEIDPYAAQWLRNLIKAGEIAAGDVDERSIVDIKPDELRGYTQAHFFAGIGGWSIALRLAGWPDDRPVWTGSCPCQPFSAAGAGKAADDERHLWPAWFPLIAQRRPPIVFGEQVEAAVGWGWLDAVFADLEGEGYACGATVLPACGLGAPHIRQRLWFVADAGSAASERDGGSLSRTEAEERGQDRSQHGDMSERLRDGEFAGRMANADGGDASAEGLQRGGEHGQRTQGRGAGGMAHSHKQHGGRQHEQRLGAGTGAWQKSGGDSPQGDMGHAAGGGQREFGNALEPRSGGHVDGAGELGPLDHSADARHDDARQYERGSPLLAARPIEPSPVGGFWADAEWIACTDGKARPVGPGSFPLGHGIQRRASKLRAYGNAIVPQVAAAFIAAAAEVIDAER